MNIEHSDSPEPVDQGAATEAAAAPKRKPRARKPAEADAVAAAAEAAAPSAPAVEAGPAEAAAAGAPEAKPARAPRKPRTPKAATEDAAAPTSPAAPVASASEPAPPAAQETVAKPARRSRTTAAVRAEAAAADTSSAASGAVEAASVAPAVQAEPPAPRAAGGPAPAESGEAGAAYAQAQAGGERGDPGQDGQGSEAGEGGESAEQGAEGAEGYGEGRRERSRNRRRGRRGSSGRQDGADEGAGLPALPPDAVLAQPDSIMPALEAPDTSEVFNSLLSGDFDAEQPAELPEPEVEDKRVLAPDPDAPKLHKVLAQSGIGSRRDMEQMIQEGRVSVNGETAHIGMRISFGDRIAIDGKPAKVRIQPPPPRIIAYHKPVGEVVTHDDPQQRPTVFRRLPRLQHGKWQSVGRLDINTEGLLLFTNSGDLANKLMHPRFGVEREYAVRVLGTLEKEARQQLLDGVTIEGQPAAFKSIEEGGGEGINRWYRVVITEGRNREVRKLFDAVGLTVSRLIRVRYGCVVLPRGLKRGVWVDLAEGDVKALRQLAGGPQPQHTGQHPAQQGGAHRQDARQDGRRDGGKPQRPPQPQPQARRGNEPRQNAPDRNKPPREDRERRPRPPNPASQGGDVLPREFREPGDPTRIPNPLQQTFDKRAMQRERHVAVRDELYEDGPIPNPLEQTYDKRFVQGQRGGGFGNPNQPRGGKGGPRGGAPGQPDPLKTAVGYIGADAFTRKSQGGRGGPRGGRRGGR